MAFPGTLGNLVPPGEDANSRRIIDLERGVRELGPSIAASFAPVIADLQAQQAALETQQDALTTQQAALTSQQATLTAQQATLTAQVASISTLQGEQTTADTANTSQSGITLTTSTGSYTTVTFTVPAGYTQAAVTANTAAAIGSSNPAQIATRIGGTDGPFMNLYPGAGFANGASNFSRKFSVTPGGTFTVETRAFVSAGTATAFFSIAATVIYFR